MAPRKAKAPKIAGILLAGSKVEYRLENGQLRTLDLATIVDLAMLRLGTEWPSVLDRFALETRAQ